MRLRSSLPRILAAAVLAVGLAGCAGGSDGDSPKVIGSDGGAEESESEGEEEDDEVEDEEPAQDFVVASGFTTGEDSIGTRYTTAGAKLTNPNADLAAYEVQVLFNLIGADGDVLDSSTETVYYVGPGETVPVAPLQIGFDQKEEPTELQVQVIGEFVEDEGPKGSFGGEAALLEVKAAEIVKGDYGDQELSAQVSNPTDQVVEYPEWDCVYSQGKKIVGGQSSSIIDPIPPGSTVQFSDYVSVDGLKVSKVECRVVVDL